MSRVWIICETFRRALEWRLTADETNFQMRQLLRVAVAALLLAGCRQSVQPTATPDPSIQISLDLTEAHVGKTTLVVIVKDATGAPISDARVEIVGDMNHAGMAPSLGEAERGTDGRYEVPFEWTMGGEWIVTVRVTLADGRTVRQQLTANVRSS